LFEEQVELTQKAKFENSMTSIKFSKPFMLFASNSYCLVQFNLQKNNDTFEIIKGKAGVSPFEFSNFKKVPSLAYQKKSWKDNSTNIITGQITYLIYMNSGE